MPLFGHNVDIFAFACNFTMEYFNDFTLSEYMTIVFSINDNIHIIETGLKARDEFPSSKLLTYLNDIKEEIANQNYFDAFQKFLSDIDTKADIEIPEKDEKKKRI